jgi:hypothetical protein
MHFKLKKRAVPKQRERLPAGDPEFAEEGQEDLSSARPQNPIGSPVKGYDFSRVKTLEPSDSNVLEREAEEVASAFLRSEAPASSAAPAHELPGRSVREGSPSRSTPRTGGARTHGNKTRT